jgi:hypothetical protein
MTPSSLSFLENECLTKASAAIVGHCLISLGRIRGRPYSFYLIAGYALALFQGDTPGGWPWGWLVGWMGWPGLAWHLLSPPPIAMMTLGSFVTCGGFRVVCSAACMMTTLAEARADTGSTCRWLHLLA